MNGDLEETRICYVRGDEKQDYPCKGPKHSVLKDEQDEHANIMLDGIKMWYCESCIAHYEDVTRHETQWLLCTLYTLVHKYPGRVPASFWTKLPFKIISRIGKFCALPPILIACSHCDDYHEEPALCEYNFGNKQIWDWIIKTCPPLPPRPPHSSTIHKKYQFPSVKPIHPIHSIHPIRHYWYESDDESDS